MKDKTVVVGFHINNQREDYARAFRCISTGENDDKIDIWFTLFESTNIPKRKLAEDYEERFHSQEKMIKGMPSKTNTYKKLFCFHVKGADENDIVNLHYFFLAANCFHEENGDPKKCLLIIELSEKDLQENKSRISSFLMHELLTYDVRTEKEVNEGRENQLNRLKLINAELSKTNKKPKQFELERRIDEIFFCYQLKLEAIHHKNLNVSESFFPLLKITNDLNSLLSSSSDEICDSAISILKKYHKKVTDKQKSKIYNDFLLKIVRNDPQYIDLEFNPIEGFVYNLENSPISRLFLLDYVNKCCITVSKEERISGVASLSNFRENLIKLLEHDKETLTVLALCILFTLLAKMSKETKTKLTNDNLQSILTDAQDYASGIMQLLENVTTHSQFKEGYFCYRIHNCDKNDNDLVKQRLEKRYPKKTNDFSEGFFLEVLISDYNEVHDLVSSFKDRELNIVSGLTSESTNDCLYHSYLDNNTLSNMQSLILRDFFEYDSHLNDWKEFYKDSNNVIYHYGLLLFKHLTRFADGEFHLMSSKKYEVDSKSYYPSNEDENSILIHIPGSQYEILLPMRFRSNTLNTGLIGELPIDDQESIHRDWKQIQVETKEIVESSKSKYEFSQKVEIIEELKEHFNEEIKKPIEEELNKFLEQDTTSKCTIESVIEKIKERTYLFFDVSYLGDMHYSEYFAKYIISLIFKDTNYKYIVLANASYVFMSTFTRIFSIMFMKAQSKERLADHIIFCMGNSGNPEAICFYGSSIHDSLNMTKSISIQSEQSRCTEILAREAEKSEEIGKPQSQYPIINPVSFYLFNRRINYNLETRIQDTNFGCCLPDTHMRIGTKIHITGNYYEASLLFSLSGYVSHFAYYVADTSWDAINNESNEYNVVIVGYETYSENLVLRILSYFRYMYKQNARKNIEDKFDYIIYNEEDNYKFLRWNDVKICKETRYIIVVPIGSTLTTHDKIVADLRRTLTDDKGDDFFSEKSILKHYALIMIRQKDADISKTEESDPRTIERKFWNRITIAQDANRKWYQEIAEVEYKYDIGASNKVNSYFQVESLWHLPNECQECFPNVNNLVSEKPLIQANRASVVPMTMMGLAESINNDAKSEINLDKTIDYLKPLEKALCYGHITRDEDNHFEYYFESEKVFYNTISSNKNIEKWFKASSDKNSATEYNFIVAPLHNTNAAFVYMVNSILRADQIIWLELKKEYRDNVKAKFSNITALYQNCIKQTETNMYKDSNDIYINFHYVDDTVTTGSTLKRAKSLISSLIRKQEEMKSDTSDRVHVKLFASISLVLNRCSDATKRDYIDDIKAFHSLINLNVSNMRNYLDACVACKNEQSFENFLPKHSSTNLVALESIKYAKRFRKIRSENIKTDIQHLQLHQQDAVSVFDDKDRMTVIEKFQRRNFYRLVLTHIFNVEFERNSIATVESAQAEEIIWKVLETICKPLELDNNKAIFEKAEDLFISALKVITRPFLSFRKSVNMAAMKVLLTISEFYFEAKGVNIEKKSVKIFLEKERKSDSDTFLYILLSCLACMRSNYLLRLKTIKNIIESCKKMEEVKANKLIIKYIFSAKQTLCLGKKENLSIWLEKALHISIANKKNYVMRESFPNKYKLVLNDENGYGLKIWRLLYLENIKLICDALHECQKAIETEKVSDKDDRIKNVVDSTLTQYFCKDYVNFANVANYSIDIENNKDMDIVTQNMLQEFYSIFELYHYLQSTPERRGENEDRIKIEREYYEEFLKLVNKIMGADKSVLIIAIPDEENYNNTYFKLSTLYWTPQNDESSKLRDRIEKFAHETLLKDKSNDLKCVGETFYYKTLITQNSKSKKDQQDCMACVKFVNTFSNTSKTRIEKHEPGLEYFLAFHWENSLSGKPQKEGYVEELLLLKRARNLLAMRDLMLKRLKEDFDSNIRDRFIKLQEQVEALKNEKIASHTPYADLKDEFQKIVKSINNYPDKSLLINVNESNRNNDEDRVALIRELEWQQDILKLISDSVVSKLFISKITGSKLPTAETTIDLLLSKMSDDDKVAYQKGRAPMEKYGYEGSIPIRAYRDLLQFVFHYAQTNNKKRRKVKANSKIESADKLFDKSEIKICAPRQCTYIWICAVIACIYNALYHGVDMCDNDNENLDHVNITIKNDDNYLYIYNDSKDSFNIEEMVKRQKAGSTYLTLEALQYFFDIYFGKEEFYYKSDKKEGGCYTFYVRIPFAPKV
jgi:hypothetical protein